MSSIQIRKLVLMITITFAVCKQLHIQSEENEIRFKLLKTILPLTEVEFNEHILFFINIEVGA